MTTFGGATVPPLFGGGGASNVFVIDVDNSSVDGIVTFGPWAFPLEAVCTRGSLRLERRDVSGDSIIFQWDWGDALADKCANIWRESGVQFDVGGAGYSTDGAPTSSTNQCSHGRWEAAAGVSRTVTRATNVRFRQGTLLSPCPGSTIVFQELITITAVFSG